MEKIYLNLAEGEVPTDLLELMSTGFTALGGRFVETYHDEECTQQQCHAANRSFSDLLAISQTYFPQATETDLIKVLAALNKTPGALTGCRCAEVGKLVFFMNKYYCNLFYRGKEDICYTVPGTDGYTIEYLEKLLANAA